MASLWRVDENALAKYPGLHQRGSAWHVPNKAPNAVERKTSCSSSTEAPR